MLIVPVPVFTAPDATAIMIIVVVIATSQFKTEPAIYGSCVKICCRQNGTYRRTRSQSARRIIILGKKAFAYTLESHITIQIKARKLNLRTRTAGKQTLQIEQLSILTTVL